MMNHIEQNTLRTWEIRLKMAQIGHYIMCEKYVRNHKVIGYSLILLPSLLTGCLFLDNQTLIAIPILNEYKGLIPFLMAVFSILCIILASLQMFMRPMEQSELHRKCATKYEKLQRDIEVYLSGNEYMDINDFILDLVKDWENVAEYAPVTTDKAIEEARKRYGYTHDHDENFNL